MPSSPYRKRRKKKDRTYHPPKQEAKKRWYPTANAKVIHQLMLSNKVRGNYKDYVILAGARLMDWLGSYNIVIDQDGDMKTAGVRGIALIHKSKLIPVVGKEMADQFWNHDVGMRTNMGVESRRTVCAKCQ